jgi:TonB family protein
MGARWKAAGLGLAAALIWTGHGWAQPSAKTSTNPDWLQKPTVQQMMLVWPRAASFNGGGGKGVIKCVVNVQGLAQACTVESESPAGKGFGAAALKLAPMFLFKPATRDGQPVESSVSIPINFQANAAFTLPNAVVVDAPAWSKAPSAAEIIGQLDKKVGDRFADGKVVFMCDLNKKTGKVAYCIVANSSPGMAQFADVAKSLSGKFEADPKSMAGIRAWLDPNKTEALVLMPFSFPDMTSPGWGKRYITHVQWVSTLDDSARQALYPQPALKAGLKEGSAMVDCAIGADGTLSDCAVKSESKAGVGFGEAATKIAEGSVANRWTEEGLPVEGARVELPIQMTYAGAAGGAPH